MSLLDDVASLLVAASLGTVQQDIFLGAQPDSPETTITLYETGGWNVPDCPDENLEYPTFQARVRNADYDAGKVVLKGFKASLNWQHETIINGVRYLLILQRDEPRCWGMDSQRRWEWTQNFEVIKEIDS